MKLIYADASPFARKVTILLHELGLVSRVELATLTSNPITPNPTLAAAHPTAKIPTLVLDDGASLYDSRVICEYLADLAPTRGIFPPSGPARWTALRQQALGDAIMDAAVLTRYLTTLPPPEKKWDAMIEAQMKKVASGLDAIEGETAGLGDRVDIGAVTIGCALGYLDFRFAHLNWRATHPALAVWFDRFAARPSMIATAPKG